MGKTKIIAIAAILTLLLSCGSKKQSTGTEEPGDVLVGSTLDNINNSQHALLQFQVEGKVCFATINQFFKGYEHKKDFPLSLWVTVETLKKNEKGHPVDKEASLFNSLEDSLISKFDKKTPFCYIGRTTRDGYRELMFYVADKAKAQEIMNSFIQHNSFGRKIDFTIDLDPTWESVGGFY